MYRHLLVPLDTTDLSIQVVSNAAGLARSLGARITFLHATTEPGAADRPTGASAHAHVHELLAKAEAGARAVGVPCESRSTRGDPAAAIIAAARELGCDLIVMASHGLGAKPGTALGSQTLSVLAGAALPVLVTAIGEPKPTERAIAVIRDEHRSIAAVIHGAMALLARARGQQAPVDVDALRAAVAYLRGFPLTQHHPREEQHLFSRLRQRTGELDAELAELERQHVRDRTLIDQMSSKLQALQSAASRPEQETLTRELDDALVRYAELHWEHMGREETVVLPAAQEHLTPADWEAISAAFAAPATSAAQSESGASYSALLDQVLAAGRART